MPITIREVSKNYGSQKALDHINTQLNKGEITGFLGPNGAGKSTLLKIITGNITDFQGDVLIDNQSIKKFPLESKRKMGYLPEHNPLYPDMYIKEYLEFTAQLYRIPKSRIAVVIEEVGLQSHTGKKIKELSKGYRQRVGIAATLLHNPEILILDEPTTGLDPNQILEIRRLIKNAGKDKTVLFSTHILQEVEAICDRVLLIDKGKIVADKSLGNFKDEAEQIVEVSFDYKIEIQLLQKLPHIKTLKNIQDNLWELHFDTNEDQRAQVFDFARDNGLRILSMVRKNKNLESVFHALTQ